MLFRGRARVWITPPPPPKVHTDDSLNRHGSGQSDIRDRSKAVDLSIDLPTYY